MPVRPLQRSRFVRLTQPVRELSNLTNAGRNILAGIFPLVANFMFTNLTYPGASSLLGGIVRTLIQPSCPNRAY